GRGLVFERFLQIARPFVQLVEQSDILDRDNRLVGERFQEIDLLVAKGLLFLADQGDRADRLAVVQHWHRERCIEPALAQTRVGEFWVGQKIGDMCDLAAQDRPRRDTSSPRRYRKYAMGRPDLCGGQT